jgi:molecular chaperone Hsp33
MGPGKLMVRKNFEMSSTGVVASTGDVCTDTLGYLDQSEQRRCAMNLWVDLSWDEKNPESPVVVRSAYGYLLECLPDTDLRRQTLKTQIWEDRLKDLGTLSKWNIDKANPVESMIHILADGSSKKEVMTQNIRFHCNCSEERAERALALAVKETGEPQVEAEIIRCEFCGKTYEISPQNH